MEMKNKRICFAIFVVMICTLSTLYVSAEDNTSKDTYISDTQVYWCEYYGNEYGICPEVLESIIESESSGKMSARNGSCYGICQINGDVWGYDLTTEQEQIQFACELLVSHLEDIPDMAYALDCYNGNSHALENYENGVLSTYSKKVLNRSAELERVHGI